jgi:four helix bundle protein
MVFRSLEEMHVYQKALAVADDVSAILERTEFRKDFKLHGQLSASSSRVPALIAEGYEQKTDRHFAHYLYIAKGSAKESRTHLIVAMGRKYLSKAECDPLSERYLEVARMLSGLITHLERENRQHRRPPRD